MRLLPILVFLATTLFHQTDSIAIKKGTEARCDDAVITDRFSIGDVRVTHFTCPHEIKPKPLILAKPPSVSRSDVELQCVNSELCTYLGADHATDVIKADCDFITATLENTPGSVLLPSQGTTAVTHQTCEFILFNLAGAAVQLSYWNWLHPVHTLTPTTIWGFRLGSVLLTLMGLRSWPLKHLCSNPRLLPGQVPSKLCQDERVHPAESLSTPAPKYSMSNMVKPQANWPPRQVKLSNGGRLHFDSTVGVTSSLPTIHKNPSVHPYPSQMSSTLPRGSLEDIQLPSATFEGIITVDGTVVIVGDVGSRARPI
ncbi:hypothetical protein C8R44DRAFT_745586 [Mycena epipterygia]|nr:hypothetical protein C8R44DRAFT_745586 [Mycena epipterygia]